MEKQAKTGGQTAPKPKTQTPSPKTPSPKPQNPNKYAGGVRDEAKDLYVRGVSLERIARYLAVPTRTLTNWQAADNWKEEKKPALAARRLLAKGFAVGDIAAQLEVTPKTIRNWLKQSA